MSRSGYDDDLDPLALGRWRAQVASAIRGKRGQKLLSDLLVALDAMPDKRLIREELEAAGEVCALGALGRHRGVDMTELDPDEPDDVAAAFDIAEQLAREIVFENDEHGHVKHADGTWGPETPEERWTRMRTWVVKHIGPAQQRGKDGG